MDLSRLISDEPAWPQLRERLGSAQNDVAVLSGSRSLGEETLVELQVSDRSPMGAIALNTNGLRVDHGWLRLLGGGGEAMQGDLLSWNGHGDSPLAGGVRGALIVAHDVVGGFFALNAGAFDGRPGEVSYAAPDSLAWEPLGYTYSELVEFACSGDLGAFYESFRWPGWRDDVAPLSGDEGFSLYPPPFTAEGKDVSSVSRRVVPMAELWGTYWGAGGFAERL